VHDRPGRSGGSGRRPDRSGSTRRGAGQRSADWHGVRQGRLPHDHVPSTTRLRRRVGTPPRPRPQWGRQLVKMIAAMLSALVFGVTGYGWSTFRELHQGLSTTDVIGAASPDKATDILLVGLDSRTDAHDNPLPRQVLAHLRAGDNEGELTDTMILVRIPNDGQHAVAISLPRDLYVELPEGYGKHKLNSAFTRAKSATAQRLVEQGADAATVRAQSVAAGRKELLQAVKDLTGVGIDHYAEINLLGFALVTDAVGGVPVCLRAAVHDKFSGANFPAGPQLISGPDALAFVRQRHGLPRGDLDRIVRQQAYLASLANKILTAGTLANPSRIRQLINVAQQSLVLDEGFDVLDFATRMQGLTAGNVAFETVPVLGDGDSDTDGSVLKVNPEAVRAFVAQAAEPPTSTTAGPPAPATIVVDVFNGAAVAGLAKSVSEQLAGQGFGQGSVGNSATRAGSVVRYPAGDAEAGHLVADALGGLPIEEDANLSVGTIQVYLGKDYPGLRKRRIGGGSLQPAGAARAEGAAQTLPETVYGERTSGPAPATAVPPTPEPPKPTMVGGKVPCVS
jgi:LCP family protein required for cell wall assembly